MRLQIEKQVYGGMGLAHTADGQTAFVPYTLAGEVADVELSDRKGSGIAEGELLRIAEASPDRVAPRCRHFGICGGCQYQHAAYPAQLAIKRQILAETLSRAGVATASCAFQVHAGDAWEYRNRIRLRVEESGRGEISVGYNLRGSEQFLAIAECPIAAPLLWRAAAPTCDLAAEDAAIAAWLRATAELELSCTNDASRLHLLVLLRGRRSRGFAALCDALHARLPELAGATAVLESGPGRRTPVKDAAWGTEGLPMQVAGRTYWVSPGGFFQVNRSLTGELVRLVTDGRRGVLAWDLFAGVGLFARALAGSFGEITAVEAAASAAEDLRRARVPGVHVVAQPVLHFLRHAALQRDRPDLVVLDPPRAGLGVEGARLLGGLGSREIVYVSCDPSTLGRDLRAMVDSGYNLAELHLVDLFPQTFHLETVAVLRLV